MRKLSWDVRIVLGEGGGAAFIFFVITRFLCLEGVLGRYLRRLSIGWMGGEDGWWFLF